MSLRMILSVIIVNYNVKFFLEQCLSSLTKAVAASPELNGKVEVIVIDNASTDGSVPFLEPIFPAFQFIQNKENKGFAKANNQAIPACTGEFVLFLNPDTILAEDLLEKCILFLRRTTDAGALGLRMIDGSGKYLKESKRGFPSPLASFYKMSGLSRIFPRSKKFSAYYMSHLNEDENHSVEILSGAFMMVRKNILDKTGGFDEQFFMYAEDIDLSFRISQTGFRNYYFSGATLIHFKGESTPKDRRQVKIFYHAMILFMKKHFKGSRSSVQLFFLQMAVKLQQQVAILLLPFRKQDSGPRVAGRVYISGDSTAKKHWALRFKIENMQLTDHIDDATEIIYCEGAGHSWKSIIEQLGSGKKNIRTAFHGAGTHSAVGSASGNSGSRILEL